MKRFTAIITILIFTICTVFITPDSYAAKYAKDKNNDKRVEKNEKDNKDDKDDKDDVVEKDTSWFDYENPKKYYKISTEGQLIGLSSLVNEEQIDKWKPTRLETFEGVTFVLTRDIKLTEPWIPIGKDSAAYFAGKFDGNGHTISNIKINKTIGNTGFFGYLTGEVVNLTVEGKNNSNDSNSGGLVGVLAPSGFVNHCTSNVSVQGKDKTGGIVGYNDGGHIEGCINLGNVKGTYKVGGVVGENWGGKVYESGNRGTVTSSRRGVATYGTGGVAGRSVSTKAEIAECYNVGEIISNTEATGGVVGYINAEGSSILDSYNTGLLRITLKASDKELSTAYIGGIAGIVGMYGVQIRNCYNAGIIKNADISGGAIGHYINRTEFEQTDTPIKNNYYTTSSVKDGIGKTDDANEENLLNATTGVSDVNMHSMVNSLSIAYMKDTGSYGNNGYPVLRWQEPISITEKVYFDDIPVEIQDYLDKHLVDTADKTPYGQTLITIIAPENLANSALILYMDAQEKIKEQKKDDKKKQKK